MKTRIYAAPAVKGLSADLNKSNGHLLEVVCSGNDKQLQVVKK